MRMLAHLIITGFGGAVIGLMLFGLYLAFEIEFTFGLFVLGIIASFCALSWAIEYLNNNQSQRD